VPGSYTVAETVPTGWDLTSAVCDDGSAPSDISLDPGETVTCTFTNTQRGTITVVKQTDPDGSTQLFDFTSSYSDPFQLADGQSETSGPLEPGIYSVTETVPAGWDLTSVTCGDGSSPDSIELASGESVTCTFENRQRGAITIVKTDDAGAELEGVTFALYADLLPFGGSPGQEDIDPGAVGSCVTDAAGTCTVGDLVPDVSYWVVETPLDGYVEPDPVVELVEPGQTVTVERVNVREFQIITYVCKTADQSLYASTVDDAGNVVQTLVDVPQALADKGVTAAELCGLAANLGGKTAGSHPLTVDIPVNQVP
jgi:hypothetical protein